MATTAKTGTTYKFTFPAEMQEMLEMILASARLGNPELTMEQAIADRLLNLINSEYHGAYHNMKQRELQEAVRKQMESVNAKMGTVKIEVEKA